VIFESTVYRHCIKIGVEKFKVNQCIYNRGILKFANINKEGVVVYMLIKIK